MDLTKLSIAFTSALTGSLLQSVCGFGNGPVNMTVFPYLWPFTDAVTLTTLTGTTTAFLIALSGIRHINVKVFVPCTTASIIFTVMSVRFSLGAARSVMMHSLGTVFVLLGLYNIFFSKAIKIKPTLTNGLFAGAICGIFSGLFATSGPPSAIFMLAATTDNDEYRSTINALFGITGFVSIVTRTVNGAVTVPILYTWLILLVAVAAGILLGTRIFNKLDSKRLGTAVYAYIFISGIIMLFN